MTQDEFKQTSNISGVLKYPEVTEDLSDEMPQKKSVTSIQQRGNSETATLHPTSMGVKVSEDFVEAIGEEDRAVLSSLCHHSAAVKCIVNVQATHDHD